MIKLKLKDKKNYYDIKIKGKNYNLIQYVSLLDIIIRNIRKDYNMNMKEILDVLVDYKKSTFEIMKGE